MQKQKDFTFIPEKGEIIARNSRHAMVGTEFFADMIKEFESIIGPSALTLIYRMSFEYARNYVKDAIKAKKLVRLAMKLFEKNLAGKIVGDLSKYGLGLPFIEKLDISGETIIRIENSLIGTQFKNRKTAVCSYIAGLLAGGISGILEKEYECEEIACVSKGDETCRFVLKPLKNNKK